MVWRSCFRASATGTRRKPGPSEEWNMVTLADDARRDTGDVTRLDAAAVTALRADLRGDVVLPDDDGYAAARRIWNGMIDRRPAAIARCAGAADVRAALAFADREGLDVSVRGGGHNVAGTSLADGALLIDLSAMRSIRVDPAGSTVRVEPGVRLGELDRETQAFGLAVPIGIATETGLAGLALGGGIGWLMRRHGLTSDSLVSADVVTADGTLVHASDRENADLFWGLRGGGGNFGIVTSFEFRAYRVGPEVLAGPVIYALDDAPDILRRYRDWAASAPDDAASIPVLRTVLPLASMPAELHGRRVLQVVACHLGDPADAERDLRPLRELGRPLLDRLERRPFRALQSMFDAGVPHGKRNYWKSEFLGGLSDGLIDAIVSAAAHAPGPWPFMNLFQLGGAIGRVPADATAYGDRDAAFALNIVGMGEDPAGDAGVISWVRETWTAALPYSTGHVYVNFLGEEGDERVRAAYDVGHYARLADLKSRWDPGNRFRHNQNVRPATPG